MGLLVVRLFVVVTAIIFVFIYLRANLDKIFDISKFSSTKFPQPNVRVVTFYTHNVTHGCHRSQITVFSGASVLEGVKYLLLYIIYILYI